MSQQKNSRLNVIARAPFNVYYEGDADSVTATNRVGEFDILPGHADFFSVLQEASEQTETRFVLVHDLSSPLDSIVHTLPASAGDRSDFRQSQVVLVIAVQDLTLIFREQISVKIEEQLFFYLLFHTCPFLTANL